MKELSFKNSLMNIIFIIAFSGILYVPFIGDSHLFDWDEINFAEAAREMIETGDYLTVRIDYEPFHEKPPLFIWLQVLSMKTFGITEFAARFPNAIIGIISMVILFSIGRLLIDERFGFLFVMAYTSSILPLFYFKSGLIDPLFNLLMFVSVWYLFKSFNIKLLNKEQEKFKIDYKFIVLAGLFDGLAVLTKGPVGFLLVVLTFLIFNAMNYKKMKFPFLAYLLFGLISFIPIILWYIALAVQLGDISIIYQFVEYQIRLFSTGDAGHGGPFYYHFLVLLFGVFPASIFALRGIRNTSSDQNTKVFSIWMGILFFVVLILFSIVKTKIVHYSSLAYFPIAFFAAKGMYNLIYNRLSWKQSTNWLIAIIGLPIAIIISLLPFVMMNVEMILPKIKDKFTYKILSGNYFWEGNEWIPGVLLLIGIVIALILMLRKKYLNGIVILYGFTTIFMVTLLPFLVPKIEQYTQLTPITFYKSLQNEDCYIFPIGFKTYAHYFYAETKFEQSRASKNMSRDEWHEYLLEGDVDKKVYFISKYSKYKELSQHPNLIEIFNKNGWVGFVRK